MILGLYVVGLFILGNAMGMLMGWPWWASLGWWVPTWVACVGYKLKES